MVLEIRRIDTSHGRRTFLTFPWRVFRGDPLWVPPILEEWDRRMDPEQGPWFQHGTAELFIAWKEGEPVGTICCAKEEARNEQLGRRDCIFGFNHYVRDYEVAAALWDHAATWARRHGLDNLHGPFNLDYEDGYGILVEGYDRPPTLFCGHTPPYYHEFVERYGFGPGREQNIAFEASLNVATDPQGPATKLHRVANKVRERGRVSVRSADLDDWDGEVDCVVHLLNETLKVLPDHVAWDRDRLESLARGIEDIIDPELVLFGMIDGREVGFLLGLPNLNEVLMYANGLRYPWDKLRAWWAMRRRPECLCMKSILVLPSYWGRGVAALMLHEICQRALVKGYRWLDMSITGADNPMTPRLAGRLGARIYKRWQVYSKTV